MSENDPQVEPNASGSGQEPVTGSGDPGKKDPQIEENGNSKPKNDQVPLKTYLSEKSARQDAEAKLAEIAKKEEEARQAKMQEEGEYKTLIEEKDSKLKTITEELESIKGQNGEYEKVVSDLLESEVKKFPEDKREAAQKLLDKMPKLTDKLELLPDLQKTFGSQTNSNVVPKGNGGQGRESKQQQVSNLLSSNSLRNTARAMTIKQNK